jgi:hypothetical protein
MRDDWFFRRQRRIILAEHEVKKMLKNRLDEIGKVIQTHWAFSILGLIATLFTIGGGVLWACGQLGGAWAAFAVLAGPLPLVIVGAAALWRSSPLSAAVIPAPIPARPIQKMKCRFCDGSGHMQMISWPAEPCIICHGKGYIFTDRIGRPKCTFCWGHAYRFGATNTACPVCGGVGLMPWD